ncbi:MAG: hypothetical protein ACI8XV_001502 [Arenicella sp.]|jgi:hypothetical protein
MLIEAEASEVGINAGITNLSQRLHMIW